MEIIYKQVNTKKSLFSDEIEKELHQYGEPLRWAIVDVLENEYKIEVVFIK